MKPVPFEPDPDVPPEAPIFVPEAFLSYDFCELISYFPPPLTADITLLTFVLILEATLSIYLPTF